MIKPKTRKRPRTESSESSELRGPDEPNEINTGAANSRSPRTTGVELRGTDQTIDVQSLHYSMESDHDNLLFDDVKKLWSTRHSSTFSDGSSLPDWVTREW